MDQRTREKLKMHHPEFYDATENRVAIAQEHSLVLLFKDAKNEGRSIAALFGFIGLFLSTIFTLASTATFQERFGIPASSWQAIFSILAVGALIGIIWNLITIAIRWRRKKLFSEDVVQSRFFSEDHRMKK
jgi:hypothetical protein